MEQPQSKPETIPASALVVAEVAPVVDEVAPVVDEVPSDDAVAKEASGAEESNDVLVKPENTVVANKPSWRRSLDRDIALAEVVRDKKLSYVKAWEDSEKTKADNRAEKYLSAIAAWENKKKAALEAELKKIEEQLEKKKAEQSEKMKNKMALLHRAAEEKRAVIEARRGEDILKTEEMAARYRATGTTPKKTMGCF
ncbi:Remorin [Vigna unguiculata]|uniref:Remorin n=1 Tax=Vigna unguiculata TaxID=3917 RepID=A0A4D6NHZ8_VIGUN|nr:Remorin [Vigna unguiculata]